MRTKRGTLLIWGALSTLAGTAPGVAAADSARMYYELDTDQFLVSVNGAAYSPIGTAAASGWTRSGTGVIAETVPSDRVDFGAPGTPAELRFYTTNATAAPNTLVYQCTNAEFPNAAAPHNQVFNIGWNVDPDGNRLVAGEPVLRDTWESNFDNGGTRFMERHWQYVDGAGANFRRGLSMSVNRADHTVDVVVNGDFSIFDSTGVNQRLVLSDGVGANVNIIFNSCIPHYNVSQQPFPNFLNQAGTQYIPGLVRGATDEIFVGGVNGTGVRLRAGATVMVDVDATGMQIASGATGPTSASCLLELTSTTQALRVPVMTTAERDAIGAPVTGLVIYNSTTNKLNMRAAAAWEAVTSV